MASVGDILRDTRIAQQHSIDDIAQATKIRATILVAIENNQLDVLPPPYVKSFIKTYAQVLHISTNEDIQNFLAKPVSGTTEPRATTKLGSSSQQSAARDSSASFAEQFSAEKTSSINLLVYAGLALGILVLAYYFIWYQPDTTAVSQPPSQTSVDIAPIDIQNSTSTPLAETTADSSIQQEEELQQDSLILEGVTKARVWMSIVADGKKSMQKLLDSNTSYRWSADSLFIVSLGNAGGIQFTLNGRPLPPLGKEGAIVRNLHIIRSGVVSSRSPYTTAANPRPRTSRQQARPATRSSIPSITPVEPKVQTPTLPPPQERPTIEH